MTNMLLNPSSSSTHSHHHHHHHHHHHDLEQPPPAPALPAPQPQPSEDDESRSSGGGFANNNCSITNNGKGKRKLLLEGNPEEASGAGAAGGGAVAGTGAQTGRKPRGRPPGSKNKPKCPIYVDRQDAMRPHILEVTAGCDVVECIATFGRRRQVGLCVMSATGSVCNVSLQQQSMMPPSVLPGKFDILSLSGMFLQAVPGSAFPAQQQQQMVLKISLANAQGHVVGGSVAGGLLAAGPGPVILMVATFTNPSYHRVPGDDADENTAPALSAAAAPAAGKQVVSASAPVSVAPPSVSGAQACQLTMYGSPSMACQIAPEIFHWAQHGHHPERQHF